MKTYAVKAIFDTLQGEGLRAGQRSVFVRFVGCNAWDGEPAHRDRGKAACSLWCDTDFRKEGSRLMTAAEIVARVNALWSHDPHDPHGERWVVLTGGEPMLQVDSGLCNAFNDACICIAIETNGSISNPLLALTDHICISPKIGLPVAIIAHDFVVDELKVVLPGALSGDDWTFEKLEALRKQLRPRECIVQPRDSINRDFVEVSHLHGNIAGSVGGLAARRYRLSLELCVGFVKSHPAWRLGAQLHKAWGMP